MFDEPIPWMSEALCAEVPSEVFFPPLGESAQPAKSICAACPVVAECLEFAQTNLIPHGVFGGKTTEQRRYLRKRKKAG